MDYFEQEHEIIDPQKRRIVYSNSEIVNRALELGFADTVPQHFVNIFTKPDTIYKDIRNEVHCYIKHMAGKIYTVSALEVEEEGEKFFRINSWFEDKDTTSQTLHQFVKAEYNEELKKEMEAKIKESKSWMNVLYEDHTYLEAEKYKKKGIKLVTKDEKKIVEVTAHKKKKK